MRFGTIFTKMKKDEDGERMRFCDFCHTVGSYFGDTKHGLEATMCKHHYRENGTGQAKKLIEALI